MQESNIYCTTDTKSIRLELKQLVNQNVTVFLDEFSEVLLIRGKRKNASEDYLEYRDKLWLQHAIDYGERLWNGNLLSAESIKIDNNVVSVNVSECEYKDVMFKHWAKPEDIIEHYQRGNLPIHIFSSVLPTLPTGEALLAQVGCGTIQNSGTLDMIGGSLNIDETQITSQECIITHTLKELTEETGIVVDESHIKLTSINLSGGALFFLYTCPLPNSNCLSHFTANTEVEKIIVHNLRDPIVGYDVTNELNLAMQTLNYKRHPE
ncbi:hypothetical protein ACE1BS_24645 [Aeromonas jandaei]